ncbi:thioredoxin family protein [bacterium]|nr:thioredoxin family protein [bacterium]
MAILSDDDKAAIRGRLQGMKKPVRLIFFTQQLAECQYCIPTEELVTELAELSDKLSLEKYNLVLDKEMSDMYAIDKIPAIIVAGLNEKDEVVDYGIRFFGIPSGYEFASLLEDILMISTGESGLSDSTKKALEKIDTPIDIKVFVTPTCPYCPQAVLMAHKLAFQSEHIVGHMIEASEFPHLSNKYGVMAVPKVVINDSNSFEGALPEEAFIMPVLQTAGVKV